MSTKTVIFSKFVQKYGLIWCNKDVPILINITGKYRDEFHAQAMRDMYATAAVCLLTAAIISFKAAIAVACLVPVMNYLQNGYWFSPSFDGNAFEDIGGYKVGVAIPTREEEGRREARNFEQTQDLTKLINKLDDAKIYYTKHEIVVQSVGSSSTQCIYGHRLTPMTEFGMGVDAYSDTQIEEFLKAHTNRLSYDSILVIMNSAGYAMKEDAGIVYNDNKVEYDTITPNIVERTVGGTGKNTNAMGFIQKLVEIHKRLNLNYVLAIVPRGDKTMPQGGSHSKDRILRAGKTRIVVIEVSGKQTKKFELVGYGAQDADAETICKNIKETKITDVDGKTYGSMQVFG